MMGNIYIKGNLYTNHPMDARQLMDDGIVIRVRKDVVFYAAEEKDIKLLEDDVYIEDIFSKFNIKDIIAFDNKKLYEV